MKYLIILFLSLTVSYSADQNYNVQLNPSSGSLTMISTNRGDGNVTLVSGIDSVVQIFNSTLTANRTVTLSTTNANAGDTFKIVRNGLGLFTLNVGGLKTIPSVTAGVVDVMFDGSSWILIGYSVL